MTDSLDTLLTQATDLLGKLYGIPGGILVLLTCLVVGYTLRLVKRFPNDGIPIVVILWGPVFNTLIADPLADKFPLRIWIVKNILVGLIIGGAAWFAHNKILKHFEDKIPFLKGWLGTSDVSKTATGDIGTPTPTELKDTVIGTAPVNTKPQP